MTRYTNIALKRTYVQAEFSYRDEEHEVSEKKMLKTATPSQEQRDIPATRAVETGDGPAKKKRKRSKSKKQTSSDPHPTPIQAGQADQGEANAGGVGAPTIGAPKAKKGKSGKPRSAKEKSRGARYHHSVSGFFFANPSPAVTKMHGNSPQNADG